MRKALKVAALGASVIALASAASAADADLNMNIFGASAQGTFWNTYATTFLTTPVADGGMGCASTVKGTAPDNSKLGITVGIDCAGTTPSGGKVYIRYTSDKSVEAPRAVMNLNPQGTGDCTNPGERRQAHWDGSAFTSDCLDVHVGAADVASEAFTQETHGAKNGNYNTDFYEEVLPGPNGIPGMEEIGTARQPLVVPFAFFANTSLNVDKITRQQALLLFNGNVSNWNQFGPGYENKRVVLCMRHAGSGTHATLDKAIMRGDRQLKTTDARTPLAIPGVKAMFHESSSDMMKCLQENGNYNTSQAGAIGYADADAIVDHVEADGTEMKKSAATNVKRLIYNGVGEGMTPANKTKYGYSALKNEIINGIYEFWAAQWMYIDKDQEDEATGLLYDKMMNFASSNPLPCPGMGCYWMTGNELKVTKENDSAIPHF